MIPQEVIRKKRDNQSLSSEEIQLFVDGLTNGSFSDQQIAAMNDRCQARRQRWPMPAWPSGMMKVCGRGISCVCGH